MQSIQSVCCDTIDKMKRYTPGFVLSTGCEISNRVPFENIQVIVDVVRNHRLYE